MDRYVTGFRTSDSHRILSAGFFAIANKKNLFPDGIHLTQAL
jgi:hypothetical protein